MIQSGKLEGIRISFGLGRALIGAAFLLPSSAGLPVRPEKAGSYFGRAAFKVVASHKVEGNAMSRLRNCMATPW